MPIAGVLEAENGLIFALLVQVPITLYFMTHAYFCFYHTLSNFVLRRLRHAFKDCSQLYRAGIMGLAIFLMAYTTAIMETLTIAHFPYYTFRVRASTFAKSRWCNLIHKVWAVPCKMLYVQQRAQQHPWRGPIPTRPGQQAGTFSGYADSPVLCLSAAKQWQYLLTGVSSGQHMMSVFASTSKTAPGRLTCRFEWPLLPLCHIHNTEGHSLPSNCASGPCGVVLTACSPHTTHVCQSNLPGAGC